MSDCYVTTTCNNHGAKISIDKFEFNNDNWSPVTKNETLYFRVSFPNDVKVSIESLAKVLELPEVTQEISLEVVNEEIYWSAVNKAKGAWLDFLQHQSKLDFSAGLNIEFYALLKRDIELDRVYKILGAENYLTSSYDEDYEIHDEIFDEIYAGIETNLLDFLKKYEMIPIYSETVKNLKKVIEESIRGS